MSQRMDIFLELYDCQEGLCTRCGASLSSDATDSELIFYESGNPKSLECNDCARERKELFAKNEKLNAEMRKEAEAEVRAGGQRYED